MSDKKPLSVYELLKSLRVALAKIAHDWRVLGKGPPDSPDRVEWIYKDHHVELLIDWLKVNISHDVASDFKKHLHLPLRRFHKLNFRSCQILADDYTGKSKEITWRHNAICKAMDKLLYEVKTAEQFDDLAQFQLWEKRYNKFTDASYIIEKGFSDAAKYLDRLGYILKSKDATSKANNTIIPPEKRTKPMSYRQAAKYIGKGDSQDAAEWLKKGVDDGSYLCDHISRQSHVFSIDAFPQSIWPSIQPGAKSPQSQPKST